jgi:hypothetical protein
MLSEGILTPIVYTSESKGETSTRTIVPMSVPKDNVRAIDVSELSEKDQQAMAELVVGYKEYLAGIFETTFKFEDWASHTKEIDVHPKWRTFKVSNIKVSE